jgi:isoleucyl-tRNA synthetase
MSKGIALLIEKDFDLTDRISIILEESGPYKQELINNERYICEEVLSDKIDFVNSLPISEEIEIDEVKFKVNVTKI